MPNKALNNGTNVSHVCISQIDTTKMFSNIVEVSQANHQFWIEHLLPMLNYSRQTRQPLNPMLMKDGFLMVSDCYDKRFAIIYQNIVMAVVSDKSAASLPPPVAAPVKATSGH